MQGYGHPSGCAMQSKHQCTLFLVCRRIVMAKMIMTADDSASVRQMVSFTLKQNGYDVIEAVDGRDALTKLTSQKVDVLITDLNMPNMDGLGLIRGVRAGTLNKYIPIIMLTTESQD